MKIKLVLIMSLSILFVSCVTNEKIGLVKSLNISSPDVIQAPLIVDLDVKEAIVNGTAKSSDFSLTTEDLKNLAIKDAVKNANCHILIEPTFEIIRGGNKTSVTVSGFPGTYKNFRSLKESDLKLLDATKNVILNP